MGEPSARSAKTGEVVADRLRRQIVRGELQVGDRLPPEDELTAQLGIARTTLREALRILESQRLLQIRRGRGGGPVVTMPDASALADGVGALLQMQGTTVGDLDHARLIIEPRLAGELARNHTPDDLAALQTVVDRAAAAAKVDDAVAFGRAIVEFHETIVERAGNNTLALFSRLLHTLFAQYYIRGTLATDAAEMQRGVRSYRKFVRLVASGDADGAEQHWRAQIMYARTGSRTWKPSDVVDLFDD